jgi:3-methyl-2-oxobutanoate hydroxymethyltransferase
MTNQNTLTHHHAKRITLARLLKMKQRSEKITVLTAYDATFAKLFSELGIDIILVGDTLGMVVGGHETTIPVTMEDMVYHIRSVCRARPLPFIIGDMPFLSYPNPEEALENAGLLMQAGAEMVKVEGGAWLIPIIEQLSEKGIPVCAHLGLTPQSVHILGGYKVQGRDANQAEAILHAALAQEKAGAKMLVLECVPYLLAQEITQAVSIPVIGIGAGPYCDGQVLVTHDMLGLNPYMTLTFVRNFMAGQTEGIQGAIKDYIRQVKSGEFPTLEHSFS